MLNGVLMMGVPLVALLAAAVYAVARTRRRAGTQDDESGGSATAAPQLTGTRTARPSSSKSGKCRKRRRVAGKKGQGDGRSASDRPDSGFIEEKQCEICFEDKERVQLYPCRHSDICETCVLKLLLSTKQCPFCRSRIHGYSDIGRNDVIFGAAS